MLTLRDLSAAQMAFQIDGEDVDLFSVVRFRGAEGLCQLYRFEIDLVCDQNSLAFEPYVGRACVLSLHTGYGTRWFHGIVSRFELTNETVGQCHYRAELMPALWTLTHRYGSRIFQDKTTLEIVERVLRDAGIEGDRICIGPLAWERPPREYCVQYRETDFNFICRLLEEEGIWWYFEQYPDRHLLILSDSPAAYEAIDGDPVLPYESVTGLNVQTEHVFRFRRGSTMRPGSVVLRDFAFENPRLDLESSFALERDPGLQFSDYPGEYGQRDVGATLAQRRAEEFETGRTLAIGQSNSPRLHPARTFQLTGHPSDALNASYLLTTVSHQGKSATARTAAHRNGRSTLLDARIHQSLLAARQSDNSDVRELADALLQIAARLKRGDATAHRALTHWVFHAGQVSRDLSAIAAALGNNPQAALSVANLLDDPSGESSLDDDASLYECRFECIPATVAYRPARVTPWPVLRGVQTARVVGPAGEEIHTDQYGRVKVQFNWDREGKFDEHASCWIRVSQGAAGGQYGMMFLPRVGQEVIVDFLEGDPDRPIITGRVYNADQMPPYELPAQKTRSVIKTSSTKGGGGTNEIRFDDLKDSEQILLYAQRDLHVRANNDRVVSIDRDDHLTVAENRHELIKKSRHTEITLDALTRIGGKRLTEVTGDVGEKFNASHSENVANAYYLKAGRSVVIEAGSELTLKVGGNFIKIDAQGVTILGSLVKINSGGAPGKGSLIALQAPRKPLAADTVAPGKDVTYAGGAERAVATLPPDINGHRFRTSWIEIEVVDEAGQPVVGEAVEIIGPEGEKLAGITGTDGVAHILVPEQGNCQISLPNLDASAWEQLS